MTIPAPYQRFEGEVLPEWIDWNGHLNLAYYVVLFDRATDLLFDELGLGLDYRRNEEKGTFVVETHNLYERELLVGERVRIATRILGSDDKRLHLGHEMFRVKDGERSATQELMFLHIDLAARRVSAVHDHAAVRQLGLAGEVDCLDILPLQFREMFGVALDDGLDLARQGLPRRAMSQQRKPRPPMSGQAEIGLHLVEPQRLHD